MIVSTISQVARTFGVLSNEVAEAPNAFLYSGYLWRQGHDNQTGGKKWVRRWFALRPDHCLYYYKSEQVRPLLYFINIS